MNKGKQNYLNRLIDTAEDQRILIDLLVVKTYVKVEVSKKRYTFKEKPIHILRRGRNNKSIY